ncbi:glycoside hydrolase family 19 protein [Massilia sp. SM-13]|uniref:glycoside hydrolase family 19 protein n=1 Tax=Pseudoduganella rhizocola TaxID=3382643 RepID=UPI0038B48DDE
MLNADMLRKAFPLCADAEDWAAALFPAMQRFRITTKGRIAAFLAQVGHESGGFQRLEENLVYRTPSRLAAVWPRRFCDAGMAEPFVCNAEGLANFVYAGRMGNGDAASGDGYRFRGRGLIQLTGRENYARAAAALGLDLLAQPELLSSHGPAALSAAWFWDDRGLNALADTGAFDEITRRINGGVTGLAERRELLRRARAALEA